MDFLSKIGKFFPQELQRQIDSYWKLQLLKV